MMTAASLATTRSALRSRAPLVHNLTNPVVANFTANALLALGASPAMVESIEEVEDFAALADALVINLGCVTPSDMVVMRLAAKAASRAGTPWVIDPVAVGALRPRTIFARELCAMGPAAIRGNASEILGLAGEEGAGRGVDSGVGSEAALEAAGRLVRLYGTVVAVTGAIDYVTDGRQTVEVAHGHPMMTRVTGMGCAASAIVAACLGVVEAPLRAVAHALTLTGLAGEIASRDANGPGSLMVAYIDALATDLALPETSTIS